MKMVDIKVVFNDKKKVAIDSYTYDKFSEQVILRIYNPNSCDEIIEFTTQCDSSKFSVIAKYPNKIKQQRFINYSMNLSFISYSEAGVILEMYFNKK